MVGHLQKKKALDYPEEPEKKYFATEKYMMGSHG
jgi:hypothetical protein